MNEKEKLEKISEFIALKGSYLKSAEIDILYKFVTNFAQYEGQTKIVKGLWISYSSGRKYTRKEKTTYIIRQDDKGINIVEIYQCYAHHIRIRKNVKIHNKAKDILDILRWFDVTE